MILLADRPARAASVANFDEEEGRLERTVTRVTSPPPYRTPTPEIQDVLDDEETDPIDMEAEDGTVKDARASDSSDLKKLWAMLPHALKSALVVAEPEPAASDTAKDFPSADRKKV